MAKFQDLKYSDHTEPVDIRSENGVVANTERVKPRLRTFSPFLPRKNSKHRYTASVAFSIMYKSI